MLNRKKAKGLTQPLQIFRNIRPQMGARIASLRREAAAIPQLPCPVTNSVCHTERFSLHSQVPQPPRGHLHLPCTDLWRWGFYPCLSALVWGRTRVCYSYPGPERGRSGAETPPPVRPAALLPSSIFFPNPRGSGVVDPGCRSHIFYYLFIFILMILGALMAAADRGCRLRCSIQAPQHF